MVYPEWNIQGMEKCESTVIIKQIEYDVIAYKYGGYGIFTYLYIDKITKEPTIIVWQDDHDDAEPLFYYLTTRLQKIV